MYTFFYQVDRLRIPALRSLGEGKIIRAGQRVWMLLA